MPLLKNVNSFAEQWTVFVILVVCHFLFFFVSVSITSIWKSNIRQSCPNFFLTEMYIWMICDLNRNWISTFGKSTTSRKLNTRTAIFGGFLGQWSFHQIPLSQLFTKTFWDFAPWLGEHLMWADIVAKVSAWKKIIWIWVNETGKNKRPKLGVKKTPQEAGNRPAGLFSSICFWVEILDFASKYTH